MSIIHVINNQSGGAWEIVKRMASGGDFVASNNFFALCRIIKNSQRSEVHFHQPKSHLRCFLLSLLFPSEISRFRCILHEAANYNIGATSIARAMAGYIIRFIVIKSLAARGIIILGVSDYVCRSYKIKHYQKISYLPLFSKEYDKLILAKKYYPEPSKLISLVAWVRRGDSTILVDWIDLLSNRGLVNSCFIFGDEHDVSLIKLKLINSKLRILVNDLPPRVSQHVFFGSLINSRWFLSAFEREGFGLSVFEALCAGCVCLTPRSGALAEWLPTSNFELFSMLKDLSTPIPEHFIRSTAESNRNFALNMIRKDAPHLHDEF